MFPALGEWSVNIDVLDKNYKKTFEVAEYILPKFDITIDTNKNAIYKDDKITATIRSRLL